MWSPAQSVRPNNWQGNRERDSAPQCGAADFARYVHSRTNLVRV